MIKSRAPAPARSSGTIGQSVTLSGAIISLCLVVFAVATFFALRQDPRPDPFSPPTLTEQLLAPREQNAFLRLPVISGTLNAIVVAPGSGHIWVTGNNGLLLVSQDNGASWQQRSISTVKQTKPLPAALPPEPPSAPKLKSERSPMNWLVSDAHAARPSEKNYDAGNAPPNIQQQAPSKVDPKDPKNIIQDANRTPLQRQVLIEPYRPLQAPEATIEIPPDLQSIFFMDARKGWIVGQAGALFKTTDGGERWILQPSGTEQELSCIAFADPMHGWIWGAGNTVLETLNGGESWGLRDNPQALVLRSVHFVDPRRAWAIEGSRINRRNSIVTTEDSGASWRRAGDLEGRFDAVHFIDALRGWVVDQEGVIYGTQDGGGTWTSLKGNARVLLSSLHFLDAKKAWAVGRNGMILATLDGGIHWIFQSQASRLASIHFADREHGWAAGMGGTLLHTTNSGRSWSAQPSGTGREITSVYFVDRDHGWAVEENGAILATTNGGATWTKQQAAPNQYLSCVHFTDREHGWAVGAFGAILATINGGSVWTRQPSGITAALLSVFFADQQRGWVVGEQGIILATINGGATWTQQVSGTEALLRTLHFVDRNIGWIAGNNGTLLTTINGGATWNPQPSGTTVPLRSIYFVDRNLGWAVGGQGTRLTTTDNGASWTRHESGTQATLRAIQFTDNEHGWVVGDDATLLATIDGGLNWSAPGYRRLPALWYWIVCLLLASTSFLMYRLRGQPVQAGETVADLLASDRPLQAGDPDPLDMHSISAGLARFIANRNTDPPLTIAVTGEWGTGKSSLMNLLYHDLKKRRFQPVWFNAWHHQKGEQLLASLYAHIQRQAVPPLWHPMGLLFRLRLVLRRSRRNWPVFGAVVLLCFAAYPYIEEMILALFHGVTDVLQAKDAQGARQSLDMVGVLKSISENLIGALLASPVVALILRAIRGFGLSPQRLITFGAGDGGKKSELDPGARARFAQEFEDVTASLDLGAMVLFIDDLDRCSKENVVEILETINFLTVSGRCFIILGMARQWVETCVALQFKELAEETGQEENSAGNGQAHRRQFARQYLEKLINIEVPVPVPPPERTLALLAPAPPAPASRLQDMGSSLGKGLKKLAPLFCLTVLVLAAWLLKGLFTPAPAMQSQVPAQEVIVLPANAQEGELLLQDGKIRLPLGGKSEQDQHALEVVLQSPADALEKGIAIGTLGSGDRAAELVLRYRKKTEPSPSSAQANADQPQFKPGKEKSTGAAFFAPGAEQTRRAGLGWALLAGLVIVGIGIFYLLQRPQRFTSDSKTFREALAIWHTWIILTSRTPRTIKRFLNRLRYVAMRLRAMPEERTPWERIKNRLMGKAAPSQTPVSSDQGIEPILVALGAIFHVNPAWVKDARLLEQLFIADAATLADLLKKTFPAMMQRPEAATQHAALLVEAVEAYKKQFGQSAHDLIRNQAHFLEVLAETAM